MWKSLVLLTLLGPGLAPVPVEPLMHMAADTTRLEVVTAEASLARGAMRHDVADARYLALGAQPQFASVGLLRHGSSPLASAILVAPQWVLTAGHAVDGVDPKHVTVALGGWTHEAVQVVMHPDFRRRRIGNGTDLALVRLAVPVFDVRPARRYRGYAERGQIGTAVGFGVAGVGSDAMLTPAPSGTKRAGTNAVDAIGGVIDGRRVPDNLLVADFDRPGDPSHNRTGSPIPLDLEYMPLGGDSGGGLFVESNGAWFLCGVFSGYTFSAGKALEIGMYGSLMFWTRLSLYNDWVDATTAAPKLAGTDLRPSPLAGRRTGVR
ncbi:MAG TPA: trypsin-like serine protease [Gemmatimonadaceae bacterium]|nr:trypsin-like serine protease [Gemmatimonadaceae bacterium]